MPESVADVDGAEGRGCRAVVAAGAEAVGCEAAGAVLGEGVGCPFV